MSRYMTAVLLSGLLAAQTFAQPRMFSDDFMSVATYNYVSWLAPCSGGPSTKYTCIEAISGDVIELQAVSGGGRLRCSAFDTGGMGIGRFDLQVIGAINLGQGCPDVFGVPYYQTSVPFTSPDVCMYAAWDWNNWQMLAGEREGALNGVDKYPGFANRDDDADATTDEEDEYPGLGLDGKPGVADKDDDGINGTDDEGETGFPLSDDSDDEKGRVTRNPGMKLNAYTTTTIWLCFSPNVYSGGGNIWSLREFLESSDETVESCDEIGQGAFQAYKTYSYVFCASGTCFGAMLWPQTDMANPMETLGPVISTFHTNPDDNGVFFGLNALTQNDSSIKEPYKNETNLGNPNFNNTFYVISGDARTFFPPITADFDGDHDVDGQDFMKFSKCFNGSLRPPKATCENPEANFDGDIDVDGQDFMAFSKCFNGSLRRPKCLPPILTNCGP